MHEQPPQIEKKEEKPYIEKHNAWLQEAKIAARSLTGGVVGGLIGLEILKVLIPEFNLPASVIATMIGGASASIYMTSSRK